jgi:hypothetical protein
MFSSVKLQGLPFCLADSGLGFRGSINLNSIELCTIYRSTGDGDRDIARERERDNARERASDTRTTGTVTETETETGIGFRVQ